MKSIKKSEVSYSWKNIAGFVGKDKRWRPLLEKEDILKLIDEHCPVPKCREMLKEKILKGG